MKRRERSIGLLLLVLTLLFNGCQAAAPQPDAPAEPVEQTTRTIVDLLDRQVTIPAKVDRIVAIGPGALRLYVYAGNLDYLVGVEQIETGASMGRCYAMANPQLQNLPVIGPGGPNNAPDAE